MDSLRNYFGYHTSTPGNPATPGYESRLIEYPLRGCACAANLALFFFPQMGVLKGVVEAAQMGRNAASFVASGGDLYKIGNGTFIHRTPNAQTLPRVNWRTGMNLCLAFMHLSKVIIALDSCKVLSIGVTAAQIQFAGRWAWFGLGTCMVMNQLPESLWKVPRAERNGTAPHDFHGALLEFIYAGLWVAAPVAFGNNKWFPIIADTAGLISAWRYISHVSSAPGTAA